MPLREFTLEKAISAILACCSLELNDLTEAENPKAEKATRDFVPVKNECIYYEVVKLISNNDTNMLSELPSHIEHWEIFYPGRVSSPVTSSL